MTKEKLGVYLPTEHIDNPKDYADNEDARKYDPRLRGPVDPRELEVDPRTGMKNCECRTWIDARRSRWELMGSRSSLLSSVLQTLLTVSIDFLAILNRSRLLTGPAPLFVPSFRHVENGTWDTSKSLVRRVLTACIQTGRQARSSGNTDALYEAYRLMGSAVSLERDVDDPKLLNSPPSVHVDASCSCILSRTVSDEASCTAYSLLKKMLIVGCR